MIEWAKNRSSFAKKLDQRIDPLTLLPASTEQSLLTGQVVIVGHGRVGKRVLEQLKMHGISCVVAEKKIICNKFGNVKVILIYLRHENICFKYEHASTAATHRIPDGEILP